MPTGKEPFVVHKWETADGYHHVHFGKDFNNPKNRKRFRKWENAIEFAEKKAQKQGNSKILIDSPKGSYYMKVSKKKPTKTQKKRKTKKKRKPRKKKGLWEF